jgi:GNAT superfamily N-acetyltransferase
MGIVFYTMKTEDLRIAEHLAPPTELDKLRLPGYTGILAIDEDKKVTCGLAICQKVRLERLDIVWLFVYDDFRGLGIGEQLIMAAFDLARYYGYYSIGFKVEAGDLTDEQIHDLNGYLVENGFGFGQEIVGGIWADLSDVEVHLDDLKDSGKIVSVSKIDPKKLESFVRDVSILFDDEPFLEDSFDAEISYSYQKEGNIQGILLAKAVGEVIYVYLLEPCDNEDVCGMLLKAFIDNTKGLGIRIFTVLRCNANTRTLEMLFDREHFIDAHLWQANAYMYEADMEETDEEDDPIYVSVPNEVRWLKTELFGDV